MSLITLQTLVVSAFKATTKLMEHAQHVDPTLFSMERDASVTKDTTLSMDSVITVRRVNNGILNITSADSLVVKTLNLTEIHVRATPDLI
jgi:hypothetical protein